MERKDRPPKLPLALGDIKRAVRNQILKDIAIILGCRIALMLIAYASGYYTPPVNVSGAILVEAICLLTLIMTRFWKWFTSHRAFEGEIVSVKYKSKVVNDRVGHAGVRGMSAYGKPRYSGGALSMWTGRATVCKIRVRTDAGKIRRAKYVVRDGERIADYKVGDRVRHYYGTNFMYKLPREKRTFYEDELGVPNICVMCGAVNEDDDELCDFCGASLPARCVTDFLLENPLKKE